MDHVLERLERLELENHRLRRGLAGAALLASTLLLAQCRGGTDEIAAQRFVVHDGEGRPRASLGMDEGQVRLRLFDEQGARRAALVLGDEGRPGLALFHDADRPAAIVELTPRGPSIVLMDPKANVLFRRP